MPSDAPALPDGIWQAFATKGLPTFKPPTPDWLVEAWTSSAIARASSRSRTSVTPLNLTTTIWAQGLRRLVWIGAGHDAASAQAYLFVDRNRQ